MPVVNIDRQTVIQILGCLMSNPSILSDVDKYQLTPNDFATQLDKFIFSAIYNLYSTGAENIHTLDVDTYLANNSLAKKLMEENNGIGFLQDCESYCEPSNFNYYYNRFKKLALLRELEKSGKDISNIYSDDPLDSNHDKINERFDKLTPTDIINQLKNEVAELEDRYSINSQVDETTAADDIEHLLETLKIKPEVGVKLQGNIFNTICRGGRRGKLYLRSAPSGVGKTRSMVGDACNIAYPIRWEPMFNKWVATGGGHKVLYVMTEQDPAEIQTMILAYLTGINEEVFLYGLFREEHMERITKAIEIMQTYKDNMLFAHIPDPCASVVKNLFRKYNFQKGVEYFFYDYIFSSPAMLNEYRDLKLPEYVCLRLFTTAIKNLAVELNAFILTSTQITDDGSPGFKDHHAIQGSKSIVNLVDLGCVMSRPSQDELNLVADFQKQFNLTPNCITDVYKNRRGRWTMVRIWSRIDLGLCRKYDLFVTTPANKVIDDFQIVDFKTERTPEMDELEEYYNNGVVTEEKAQELLAQFEEPSPITTTMEEVVTAFGNIEEERRRIVDKSFDDLL